MTKDATKPTPSMNVDLASRHLTIALLTVAHVDALFKGVAKHREEVDGYTRDDATEIVRRGWMSMIIGFCRTRGYSLDKIADQLEALAQRVRSGEAIEKAKEYDDELVRLGLLTHAKGADKGEPLR